MITPYLIFRVSQPDLALQLLCVLGFCLGVTLFLRGLRLRRAWVEPPDSLASMSSGANAHSSHRTERMTTTPIQETIRLSTDPVPTKSAEMTQQQKIAAALARAGTSHSTAWVHEPAGVAVEAGDPDPREDQTIPIPEIHPAQLKPLARFAYISLLLIWSGLALAILSCYLLVTIR